MHHQHNLINYINNFNTENAPLIERSVSLLNIEP